MHILAFTGAICRMGAAYAESWEGPEGLCCRLAGVRHRDTAGLVSLVAHDVLFLAAGVC